MVTRLLVPLADGPADEATLRVIADAARSAGSTVRLLYVHPLAPDDDGGPMPMVSRAERSLEAVAASLGDIPVERVIRFGDLETVILDEAAAWRADLVALSAGDRTWLSRAVRTGAAAQAFGKAGVPALLFTPSRRSGRRRRKILSGANRSRARFSRDEAAYRGA